MKLLYALTFLLISSLALAQPGGADKNYNRDFGVGSGVGVSDNATCAARQSDNSIIVAGYFGSAEGIPTGVARFKPDGTIDDTFAKVDITSVSRLLVQPDDKIILVGSFTGGILRLNADGTTDEAFKTNIGTGGTDGTQGSSMILGLALQDDGKILIGGLFMKFNGVNRGRIARLNADGTVDNGFNPGQGTDWSVTAIAIQSTGKIIIAGMFDTYDGEERDGIARLNTNGNLDINFNPEGFTDPGIIHKIIVLPDDKMIIGGAFLSYAGNSATKQFIVKTNADGTVDDSFFSPISSGIVYDVDMYSPSQIIVSGAFTSPGKGIIKLDISDGAFDPTFKPYQLAGGALSADAGTVYAAIVQEDEKIFIAGDFMKVNGTSRNFVARLLPNGNLEGGRGADNTVNAIVHTSGGSVVIAGDFKGFRGEPRTRMVKVTSDGTLDDDLDPADGANGPIIAMAKDANGKFIIAGNFTQYRGIDRARIARINDDGTLDDTFDPGTGANATIRTVAIQGDGAILIGGDFTTYTGIDRAHIARVESDGGFDASFIPGDGADGNVQSIAIQSDGKIIAAGSFTTYDGIERNNIARINTDGSHDATFDPGTGTDATIYAVKIDDDDNVVIGGAFSTVNDLDRKGVARLLPDGDVDEDFDAENDYTTVRTITIKADDRIFIGGDFTNKVALLSASGVPDEDWYPTVNPNNTVLTSVEDPDGHIIAGGMFTMYDGRPADRLARILNSGKRDQTITFAEFGLEYVGDPEFELAATSTSGLPITYSSSDETVAIIDGNILLFTGAGTTTITAMQEGNEKFNPAPSVERELIVAKGSQGIIWDLTENLFEGELDSEVSLEGAAISTVGLTPITYSVNNPEIATISEDGKKLVLKGTGSTSLNAMQEGTDDYNPSGLSSMVINVIIADVVGLEDEGRQLIVYPNPTEGPFTVQLPLSHTGPAHGSVVNSIGVQVGGHSRQVGQNLEFDLSALPRGIYLVRVQSGGGTAVKRVHRK